VILGKKLFEKYAKLILSQKILTLILGLGLYFVFDVYGIIYGLALSYIPHLVIFVKEFSRTKIDFFNINISMPKRYEEVLLICLVHC